MRFNFFRVRRKSNCSLATLTLWTVLALLMDDSFGFTLCETRSYPRYSTNVLGTGIANGLINEVDVVNDDMAFIIEKVRDPASDKVFAEISNMCIEAFFNDDDQAAPLWKQWQLGQLRALQRTDLKRRRVNNPDSNFMLVAREVFPAMEDAARTSPLILDLSLVANLKPDPSVDYVRGDVIGFVEVTKRPYGLGEYDEQIYNSRLEQGTEGEIVYTKGRPQRGSRRPWSAYHTERPLLTNLSVRKDARSCGLGSELLRRCESRVLQDWDMDEIILEVESDNVSARRFYAKRGYEELFEIPTSRRYDTNGLFLKEVRCKRVVMRKKLKSVASTVNVGWNALRRLRENVFSFV